MPLSSNISNRISGLFKNGDDEIILFIAIFLILLSSTGSKSTYKNTRTDSNPLIFLIAVLVFLVLSDTDTLREQQEIY